MLQGNIKSGLCRGQPNQKKKERKEEDEEVVHANGLTKKEYDNGGGPEEHLCCRGRYHDVDDEEGLGFDIRIRIGSPSKMIFCSF